MLKKLGKTVNLQFQKSPEFKKISKSFKIENIFKIAKKKKKR